MFHLRKKREAKPLSLPVLLSFNELAWIAAGAFALVCVFFWCDYIKKKNEKVELVPREKYIELTSRPVLGTTGMVVSVNAKLVQPGDLAISQMEYNGLTNRPLLGPDEMVVSKGYIKSLPILQPGQQAVSEAEWQSLRDTNYLRVRVGEYIELKSRPVSIPGTTNVLVSEWLKKIGEGQVRTELLNLKGSLTNVVIVLDASASMQEKGRLQVERWTEARSVIEAWLNYLPIQRCGLVIFSDNCKPYTVNQLGRPEFWEMSVASNRRNLIESIKNRDPDGNTATWSALINTYNYFPKVDTIILFTDGKPYVPRASSGNTRDGVGAPDAASISREEMKRVIELVKQHPNIPINVVGLGDYFEKEQANFLLELARITGGSFLGR